MHIYHQLLAAFDELCQTSNYTAVVKRAWQLYQSGAVQKSNVYSKNMLNGIVKDNELYAVVIDPEHIRYSTCPCQQTGYCEHIGALFFQYSKSLENGKVLAEQAYFQLLGVTRASSIVSQAAESTEGNVESYLTDPAQLFPWLQKNYGEDWRKCKHSFHSLSQTLTTIKGLARNSSHTVQRLHWCAASLFVLQLGERALQAVDSFSRYYHEMSFKRIAEPWITNVYEWLDELQKLQLNTIELSWLEEMIQYVFERATASDKPMIEWDYFCYRLIRMLTGYEKQEAKLEEKLKRNLKAGTPSHVENIIHASFAVLRLNVMEDTAAINYLNQCQFEKIQRLIYPVVEQRMQEQEWDKVQLWMEMLLDKFVDGHHTRSIGPFLSLCRKASMLHPEQAKWQQIMVALLPHSYPALTEHYISQGQYEAWTDLQMYIGRRPEDFKSSELQNIERQAPVALLPLYHQAVDISIHGRNRQGYRTAAKYMKKLQDLYIQLEQVEIWNRYFDVMQQKYSRLRAFQEELMKGKLL